MAMNFGGKCQYSLRAFSLNFRRRYFIPTAILNEKVPVSMIQGASRGIGFEFVKQLLEREQKGKILATCRNPDQATGLHDLKTRFADRLDIMKMDVTIESTIEVV